jgi:hypothetical protein
MYDLMGMCMCFVMWIPYLMVEIMWLGEQAINGWLFYLHSSCFYGQLLRRHMYTFGMWRYIVLFEVSCEEIFCVESAGWGSVGA